MTVRRTLWLLFAVFIVYGGTIPFHFAGEITAPDPGRRLSIPDVVQNVLLFVPFGALGVLSPGTRGTRTTIALVTLLGVALSVAVEGLQLFTTDRVSSVGDVVSNSAGAFIGAVLTWQLRGIFSAGVRRLQREGLADVTELRSLGIASLVLAVAAWQPFDLTLDVGSLAGKVRALEADIWQATVLRDEGIALILAAFFAATLASYLSVLGEGHAGRRAAAVGVGVVFVLESLQIFVGSRMPGLWDASVAASGILIGVAMWALATRILWPGLWLGVLVALTFVAAALQMLSPFEIAGEYRGFSWFPFLGYYTRTTFETVRHVVELMLLYFPLGFWLGQAKSGGSGGRGAMAAAVLLTLAIALPIEYTQGWIVGRYADISDVAVGLLGVWLGVKSHRSIGQ